MRVAGEVDALAGPHSVRGTLRLIAENRLSRLVATGRDFVTGEEADWMLDHLVQKDRASDEERSAIVAWLRKQGHLDLADDIHCGVHEASP
jgi:hypothetical protein